MTAKWSEFQIKRFLGIAKQLQQKHAGNSKIYWRELEKAMLAQATDDNDRREMEALMQLMKTAARNGLL
jgi:hypothetical protein